MADSVCKTERKKQPDNAKRRHSFRCTATLHKYFVIAPRLRTGIPKFQKAMVMIEITTPRGTHNPRVWDTSNRAINLIINNLKGIFFRDDDFEHMAFSVVAKWGEIGRTTIRLSIKMMKFYAVFENVIESVKFNRGRPVKQDVIGTDL